MPVSDARKTITETVTQWEGVTALPHRFGGTEYRYGEKREIGHVHGDHLLDIPFPTKLRNELVAQGRAEPHHLLSDSGWVSFYLHEPQDMERALALLRLSYDVATKQKLQSK